MKNNVIIIIRLVSDLHIEFWDPKKLKETLLKVIPELPNDKKTILILAGDIGIAHRNETWLTPIFYLSERFKNIVYCEGNHFFYGNDFFEDYPKSIKIPLPKNVHLLENKSVFIDNVLFIGATLWSDMKIENKGMVDRCYIERSVSDYIQIKRKGEHAQNRIYTGDTHAKFIKSRDFIFDELRKNSDKKCIVVTHHGPSFKSVSKKYEGDKINYAFVSDLDKEIIKLKPTIWCHGHTHSSFDYMIGETRVITNPLGYLNVAENEEYNCTAVIRVI